MGALSGGVLLRAVLVLVLIHTLCQGLPIESKLSYRIQIYLVLCGKFCLVLGYSASPRGLSAQAFPSPSVASEQVNGAWRAQRNPRAQDSELCPQESSQQVPSFLSPELAPVRTQPLTRGGFVIAPLVSEAD